MFAAQEAAEALTPSDADAEELGALRAVSAALEAEDEAKAAVDKAKNTLEAGIAKRYLTPLTEDEVRTLVVDDKWLASLHQGLSHELARLSGTLARSLTELAQRYAQPLPALEAEVASRQARVTGYLATLGFSAN
jgi:type I restriction enzyme M protein